jgi:hypothetical protein
VTDPMKLIQGYLDDRLPSEQVQALQAWINKDKANARSFARYSLLHSHIRDNFREKDLQESLDCSGLARSSPTDTDGIGAEILLESADIEEDQVDSIRQYAEHKLQAFLAEQEKLKPTPKPPSKPARRLSLDWTRAGRKMAVIASLCAKTAAGFAVMAALVLTIMATVSALRPQPAVAATIVDSVEVQWAQTPAQSQLYPGWLTLEEGFVQLNFQNGTQVVVEAPARFNLEAGDQMFLEKGRLVARAEESAVGFTVRTPGSSIVDFGTEFGVLVTRKGHSQAHVLEGQVEMRSGANPKKYWASQRLGANQACSADAMGNLSQVKQARPSAFMRYVPCAYESAVLDSRPVAYWQFDPKSRTTLPNACHPERNAGSYIGSTQFTPGPDLGDGRRPWALHCGGQENYALVQDMTVAEGEYTTGYTHVAWIRVDVVGQQTILNTHHYGINGISGGIRTLAMTPDGLFEHSLLSENSKTTARVVSKTVARPGQWYHIAVLRSAYDDRKLFVNGVEEDVAELSSAGAPRFQDTAYIGAPVKESSARKLPFFQGALSELAFYNRGLTADEIRTLYEAAQPSQVIRDDAENRQTSTRQGLKQ